MADIELLRLRLPCDTAAPRQARDALAHLSELEAIREEAQLVVSELASNAVLHSGCSPNDELEVLADLLPDGVRIVVRDKGLSQTVPARREREPLEPGGMGLQVVEALARRWGSERHGMLSVWAELAL